MIYRRSSAALALVVAAALFTPTHGLANNKLLIQKVRPTKRRANSKKSHVLRNPVILMHGFNASPDSDWGFSDEMVNHFKSRLGADRVFVLQVAPYASAENRGKEATKKIEAILKKTGAKTFHMIGHSEGGKDGVYATSPKGGKLEPAYVATIETPHAGTNISNTILDVFSETMGRKLVPKSNLSRKILKGVTQLMTLSLNDKAKYYPADMLAAHQSMRESAPGDHNDFNERFPLNSKTVYTSWAGLSNFLRIPNLFHDPAVANTAQHGKPLANPRWATPFSWFTSRHWMSPQLTAIAGIVAKGFHLKPNDGVVPTESAKGPDGFIFRGTLKTDHMGAVGQGRNGSKDAFTGFAATNFADTLINDMKLVEAGGRAKLIKEAKAWHETGQP
ncbi:MAG: hypothetical protein JRH20_21460 [Deltaproteobacteria bacterium]|nr:hypothetical protein [Deltaproteobacteria bacterium]